jgi:hypothetical protein
MKRAPRHSANDIQHDDTQHNIKKRETQHDGTQCWYSECRKDVYYNECCYVNGRYAECRGAYERFWRSYKKSEKCGKITQQTELQQLSYKNTNSIV